MSEHKFSFVYLVYWIFNFFSMYCQRWEGPTIEYVVIILIDLKDITIPIDYENVFVLLPYENH